MGLACSLLGMWIAGLLSLLPLARLAEASLRRIPLAGSLHNLALLSNPDPIDIEGQPCLAVLVPTAPVPIGGGLLYAPVDRVRPAWIGVEPGTGIYLSMGLVQPEPRTEV